MKYLSWFQLEKKVNFFSVLLQCCALDLQWEWCWWHANVFAFCHAVFILSQGHFPIVSCSDSEERPKETGREHSWHRWPELTKGMFHTTEHPVHYVDLGEFSLGQPIWVWERGSTLVGRWWAVTFWNTWFSLFINIYRYYCVLFNFKLLICSYLTIQFLLWLFSSSLFPS